MNLNVKNQVFYEIIFFLLILSFNGSIYAACQEEPGHCYYFEGEKLISESPCQLTQCANISGGIENWIWRNGNTVDVQVQNGKTMVNGKPGRLLNKGDLNCYEILGDSPEVLCHGNPVNKDKKQIGRQSTNESEICFKILGAGIYNGILEEVCGFSGGVKDKLKAMYASGVCPEIISEEEISNLSEKILIDTRRRYQAMGENAFCKENKNAYFDLSK